MREVPMRFAILAGVLLITASPGFAQAPPTGPLATARFGALRPAQPGGPYAGLFQPRQTLKDAAPAEAPSPQPTVICGMLMVPADPKIDPKMAIPPNKAAGVEFKIRVMEPPICNGGK
jgi:hypothetical protein